jgi:hypothetical protein
MHSHAKSGQAPRSSGAHHFGRRRGTSYGIITVCGTSYERRQYQHPPKQTSAHLLAQLKKRDMADRDQRHQHGKPSFRAQPLRMHSASANANQADQPSPSARHQVPNVESEGQSVPKGYLEAQQQAESDKEARVWLHKRTVELGEQVKSCTGKRSRKEGSLPEGPAGGCEFVQSALDRERSRCCG